MPAMWTHSCLHSAVCDHHDPGAQGGRRARAFTVDLHCHIMTPQIEVLIADLPQKKAEAGPQLRMQGQASFEFNATHMLPAAFPRLTRLEVRLADMDTMGVDLQVVSPSPAQYYYWAEPDLARQLVQLQNEHIAEQCARYPGRLAGLGNLSLQHPQLAVEQLVHASRTLGLKGVEVSSSVNGLELADARFDPVWAKAEELGCVVFIHPLGTSLGERVAQHYLSNVIGQPLETTVALSQLIFGGTLDRYPGLKLLAAHGGGYLPSYLGRSVHAHTVRPEASAMQQSPREYLRRIWFDTLVYEPEALRHLIAEVGASQIVVGTDYPFDMGHYTPHALLDRVTGLSEADRARILGGNALELLGLSVPADQHTVADSIASEAS